MPIEPDRPGGSHDPTRANDPIDPTRAQDPVDPTRVQPGVDPTRTHDATFAGRDSRVGAPVAAGPDARDPGDDDRKGAAWLWGLLAAVLIGIVLFALLRDSDSDDGDDVGTVDQSETEAGAVEAVPEDTAVEDTTADTAPEDTTAGEGTTEDTTTATTAAAGDAAPDRGGSEEPGTVTTADGTDLFSLVQGDGGDAERLSAHADQDVTGAGVVVLEVVEGEGFWIGADDQQRIFAHAGAEAAAEVEVGQRIDFEGFLKANPPDDSAEVHDIPEDQGAEQHRQQGHHLELRSLTTA